VTPNNPTGAVYDPGELARIGAACAERGVTLIADETYAFFVYGAARHTSLAALNGLREHVVTIGSFSKSFGLTGWRLGYLVGPADVVYEALKVQDSLVICAPVITQKAVLGGLAALDAALPERLAVLAAARRAGRLAGRPAELSWQPTDGAIFALVRVAGCRDAAALARDILGAPVVTIPGSAFGQYGEGYLRWPMAPSRWTSWPGKRAPGRLLRAPSGHA
jgi:aspartate/methionine/tyrosine aminotransferase